MTETPERDDQTLGRVRRRAGSAGEGSVAKHPSTSEGRTHHQESGLTLREGARPGNVQFGDITPSERDNASR